MENDLSSVRKNDKLFHIKYGEGVVIDIAETKSCFDKRILLRFNSYNASIDLLLWVYPNGKENMEDWQPSVFWDEVTITPPPKPMLKPKILKVYKKSRIGEACYVIHKYTAEE